REHNKVLVNSATEPDVHADTIEELKDIRLKLEATAAAIQRKSELLGVRDRARLTKLINDPFYAARVNALAVKTRLRDRLRARKFEMERVERSFRKQVNDQKLQEHTATSVQRRDPTISRLASNYNVLIETMQRLIKNRKAPPHALCPEKIETKGLYALDVDDTIWQDAGLDHDDNDVAEGPPPWLASEAVREGIKAMLEYDRCIEEKVRLQHECRSMIMWLSEEWEVVSSALETDDESLRDLLMRRRQYLCHLCMLWKKSTQGLDFGDITTLPDWGPSADELLNIQMAQVHEKVRDAIPAADDEESASEESDEEEEGGLIDLLDALDLASTYRFTTADDIDKN
ncbi:hypothetical protein H0H92_009692, partial [Tricholoma furcatifolium]